MTDLVAAARETRVVVVGGGMAGLTAALECARIGLQVTVLEAADVAGGAVDRVVLGVDARGDELIVDAAAEAFAGTGTPLADLVEEIGLTPRLQTAVDDRTWLVGPAGAAPAPAGTVLGIPGNVWAPDVRRHIEARGVWRAYLDRLRPPMTVGHERSLGELVSSRMGERVRDRLVAPYPLAVHGTDPEFIDARTAAPGLNAALTSTGSLSGAVSSIAREPRPRVSPEGGMLRVVDELVAHLGDFGVEVRTGARVSSLARAQDGAGWLVRTDGAGPDAASALAADLVVLAADEVATRALLVPHLELPEGPSPVPEPLEVVLLRLRAVALADRGSLVIGAGPRPVAARRISRTWPWLGERLPAGDEVLRITWPVASSSEPAADDAAVETARAEASALFGVEIPRSAIAGAARRRYRRAAPATVIGHADAVSRVRAAVAQLGGVAVVGGWLAGSGVAAVVADATEQAAAARHAALWAAGPGGAREGSGS